MRTWGTLAMGIVFVATGACGAPTAGQSSATDPSISSDEIAIYEKVLASWLGKEKGRQLINEELSAPPSKDDPDFSECTKGLSFSAQPGQQKSLGGAHLERNGIELIDGSKWKPADPGEAIANGKSVDAAVKEGFAHSLISFSQIAFSRDGKDALVKIGMSCGSLCGSGSTIRLHKSAAEWAIISRCGVRPATQAVRQLWVESRH